MGLVGGVLVLCTIGFFVLLTLLVRGTVSASSPTNRVALNNVAPVVPSDQGPSPSAPAGPVPPVTKQDHVRGTGSITLVEYSDFECPFCQRFHPTMLRVMNEYKGKVRWVYRHFPLSFHANAQKQAEATECANELGGTDAFWAYADKLFERTQAGGTGFALDALVPLAKELGLNESKFKTCLDSGKYAKHVEDEMNAGSAAGVTGTPGTFLIDKDGKAELISGALPYESIKAALDAKLQ
jgi:protein-disulfide isomerase